MRPLVYGNGKMLIGVDERGVIRDIYYPHGYENHGDNVRIGLYDVESKKFSWLDEWDIKQRYKSRFDHHFDIDTHGASHDLETPSLIGETEYKSEEFGLQVTIWDTLHRTQDLFYRVVGVFNISEGPRILRLFTTQNFSILENPLANTAYHDGNTVIHYKRNRYFLLGSEPKFDQYTMGIAAWAGMEGTWKDAEDGKLGGNPVAHGTVDSTVGWDLPVLEPGESSTVNYWISVGDSLYDVIKKHRWAQEHHSAEIIRNVRNFWQSWVERATQRWGSELARLPAEIQEMFIRSLLTVATHTGENGSIIASSDSEIRKFGADYYAYCWPRDASWAAIAMDRAGYYDFTADVFRFFRKIIVRPGGYFLQPPAEYFLQKGGYFLHKYTSRGEFGSTWHPVPMLQIDETGTPLYAMYHHWLMSKDVVLMADLYDGFIKPAANFLVDFIDKEILLPKPTHDLWEERSGYYTNSSATVYGGLRGAARMAEALGYDEAAEDWDHAADMVKEGIRRLLYDEELGRFKRGLGDDTIDSSLFGIWYFDVLPANHPHVIATMRAVEERLRKTNGGVARYVDDQYFGHMNSWIICTLWLAQWYIAVGSLDQAMELITWCVKNAHPSGLMPEQVGQDGKPRSVLPLTWSHSTFVLTVLEYLETQRSIG